MSKDILNKNGKSTVWDSSGTKYYSCEYVNGKQNGKYISYYQGRKREVGKAIDGRRVGEWRTYHSNGKLESVGKYKNIHKNEIKKWNIFNRSDTWDTKSIRHGKWTWYYDTGGKAAEGQMVNNKMNGEWNFWYEGPGKLKKRWKAYGRYNGEGWRHGEWHENYILYTERGEYRNGIKMGPWLVEQSPREGNKATPLTERIEDVLPNDEYHTYYSRRGSSKKRISYEQMLKEEYPDKIFYSYPNAIENFYNENGVKVGTRILRYELDHEETVQDHYHFDINGKFKFGAQSQYDTHQEVPRVFVREYWNDFPHLIHGLSPNRRLGNGEKYGNDPGGALPLMRIKGIDLFD